MRLMKTGLIVFAVVFISLTLFLSCDNGTKAVDPTAADIQKFVDIATFLGGIMEGEPPPCVTVSESSPYDPEGGTMTFTNCDFECLIVDGSVNMKMAWNDPIFSMTLSGELNFSGTCAPASSISFDFTMTIDTSTGPDYSIAVSGTITIDGTVFNASGFLNEIYDMIPY